MKLVAIRHLPTPWNLEGRLQGQQDIDLVPLDDAARSAIAATCKELDRHAPFDCVFCSKLKRTRQTAEAFGFHEISESPLLDELHFGSFEGELSHVMLDAHGHAWHHAPHELTFGETMTDFGQRVRRFLDEHA